MTQVTEVISQKLDELFKSYNRSDAPGVTVGVAHKGRLIYRRGFGMASIEHAVANSPAMRMRIGSTTKHFCALGIMLLAEDGKLDIDQAVGRYLTELDGACGKPTLLQLMQHTGGLQDPMLMNFLQGGGHYGHLSPGGTLQMVPALGINFEPGTRYAYSNTGYTLLSLVIERVSGKNWAAFMGERVFGPLGMSQTTLLRSDLDIVPNMATLHVQTPDGQWRRGIYPTDDIMGSGGIISTVDDMLAWAAHLRGARKKVGCDATWKKMLTRMRFGNGHEHSYCLGIKHDTHRGIDYIHHAGATLGSGHQMVVVPSHELDVVVMANRMDAPAAALALKALEAVLENEGLGPEMVPAAAADYPAVQGRWYARASQTLIELAARKARADLPELLLLSAYNSPAALAVKAGAGLAMADALMEIRSLPVGTAAASLEVHVCGEAERFERLPDTPPKPEEFAELCGRYRQAGYPKEFEIALREGKLVLDLLPLHGKAVWELDPYSDEVLGCGAFHSVPHFPLPNRGTISLDRGNGNVSGFWLNTDRVRRLRFDRVAALGAAR